MVSDISENADIKNENFKAALTCPHLRKNLALALQPGSKHVDYCVSVLLGREPLEKTE